MSGQARQNPKTNSSKPTQPEPILIAIPRVSNPEPQPEPRKWYEGDSFPPNFSTTWENIKEAETATNEERHNAPSSNSCFDFQGWNPDAPHLTTTRKSRDVREWQFQPAYDGDALHSGVDDTNAQGRKISETEMEVQAQWEVKQYYPSREELAEKYKIRQRQDDEASEVQSNPNRRFSGMSVKSKAVRKTSASEGMWRERARKKAEDRWICCNCKKNDVTMVPYNKEGKCKKCYHLRCVSCPCPANETDPDSEVAQFFYDKMEGKY
ncbi:hypothetical protein VTL71DRAFT_9276 [Oculimacula yallundae]|uniref:Uncharacterized protein n=1 Tax=Oculimacula yallundae TaxID=86028 RepID=A0ABR4BSK7_9HELO